MKLSGPERDDVGIEKKIAEEGFDRREGVGAAKLEEDDADAFFGLGSHCCDCDSLSWARLGSCRPTVKVEASLPHSKVISRVGASF